MKYNRQVLVTKEEKGLFMTLFKYTYTNEKKTVEKEKANREESIFFEVFHVYITTNW